MFWTAGQRVGLGVVMGALVVALAVKYLLAPAYVPGIQPDQAPRANELADRIDPNTADWPALAALPVIGRSLAQRIVEEREAFVDANPGQIPYRSAEDLLRVKGIGEATLQAIEPYLAFPSSRPATGPGAEGK